jgi:hypothetical protein
MTDIAPLIEKVGQSVADFSIGFAKLNVIGGDEDAAPAGSGALVTVGSFHGILTAAHSVISSPHSRVSRLSLNQSPRRISLHHRPKLFDDINRADDVISGSTSSLNIASIWLSSVNGKALPW